MAKILFLVPYPVKESPSQRFRFEQYFHLLEQHGHQYIVQSFFNTHHWRTFYAPGKGLIKVSALLLGFIKRVHILLKVSDFDFVFIHREVTPLGPPFFEWCIAKVLRRKIIYDFDDAIWLTDRKHESWYLPILKWRSKVQTICSWAYKVSCGNLYLYAYAEQFNKTVVHNPTTIDTEHTHNPSLFTADTSSQQKNNKIIIGWTGSHSTLKYLNDLEQILQRIERNYSQVEFLIIADRPPSLKLKSIQFKKWSLATEISDLSLLDIGIMPLPDDMWARGKCGFKALQYMAMEIPTIASAVGVNTSIINHGIDGFLAQTDEEWENTLTQLIEDKALRDTIGLNGRKKVCNAYSVSSNTSTFLSLFET